VLLAPVMPGGATVRHELDTPSSGLGLYVPTPPATLRREADRARSMGLLSLPVTDWAQPDCQRATLPTPRSAHALQPRVSAHHGPIVSGVEVERLQPSLLVGSQPLA
jgi:hypothetical protein